MNEARDRIGRCPVGRLAARVSGRLLGACVLALSSPAAIAAQAAVPGDAAPAPLVRVLRVEGPIGPATVDYVARGLAHAAREHAALVVLKIDTPGGLASSTRSIVRDIVASPVPVAAWVAPGGARAASAGAYIVYASHVAAMAPGTNLGAATPVPIGASAGPAEPAAGASGEAGKKEADTKDAPGAGTPPAGSGGNAMARKIVNDSAAWLRALAQMRGRNVQWADQAVREGVSLSADEAVAQHVVDFIAADLPSLLAQADGRRVALGDGTQATLATRGAATVVVEPDWRTRLLSLITDPSVAYVLLLLGVYGVFVEVTTPGFGVPGIAGAVLLLTGLFALQMLPVSFAGLGLIALGLALIVAEALVPSFGALGIGGSIAFALGSILLFDTDAPGFGIPIALIIGVAVLNVLVVLLVVRLAWAARRRPVVTGAEELVGASGEVVDAAGDGDWIRVHGERWRVRADAPLRPGQRVRVTGREGLTLAVEPDAGTGPNEPSRRTP